MIGVERRRCQWRFETLGENYVTNVAAVAKQYPYEEASRMILRLALNRVQESLPGRGSMKTVISKDWADLRIMGEEESRGLLLDNDPTAGELSGLEITAVQLFRKSVESDEVEAAAEKAGHNESTNDENEEENSSLSEGDAVLNDEHVDKEMEEESDDESDKNEGFGQEPRGDQRAGRGYANRRLPPGTKKAGCKCGGIPLAILERIRRKNAIRAGMKGEEECLGTLRAVVGARPGGVNLRHVCHRHLFALGGHFDLQIKALSTAALRKRLGMIWRHRGEMVSFKMDAK